MIFIVVLQNVKLREFHGTVRQGAHQNIVGIDDPIERPPFLVLVSIPPLASRRPRGPASLDRPRAATAPLFLHWRGTAPLLLPPLHVSHRSRSRLPPRRCIFSAPSAYNTEFVDNIGCTEKPLINVYILSLLRCYLPLLVHHSDHTGREHVFATGLEGPSVPVSHPGLPKRD
jgi:hypothetical protein